MLRTHWFLVAYVVTVALAALWPDFGRNGGLIHLEAAKQACIAGIFLCAGLVLPGRQLGRAAGSWRQHLAVQGTSFVSAPLIALALAWIAGQLGLPAPAQAGIIILGCLSTTIGSCVAITGMAGGNQGIALVNSVIGNVLGIVITPLLVLWLAGHASSTSLGAVISKLCLLAVLPVVIGQIIRLRLAAWLDHVRTRISVISGCLLLAIILTIFSDLAYRGLGEGGTGGVVLAVIVLYLLTLAAGWQAARLASRLPADRIAIAITSSHKTVSMGIPLVSMLYAGSPDLTMLILPIALYHAMQQLFGAGCATWIKRHIAQAG
jgi:solute carrier family 10 (sodium/bile acid cotransporter), member 7